MSPENVIRRLDNARQKWWFFSLLTTCVLAICGSLGLLLIFLLGDAWWRFSQGWLAGLFLTWLLASGWLLWIVGRRLVRNPRGLEAAARRVEAEFPELGSNLINLLQLSESSPLPLGEGPGVRAGRPGLPKESPHPNPLPKGEGTNSRAFSTAAIRHAAAELGQVPFAAAAGRLGRWQRLRYCLQTPRDLGEALGVLGVLIVLAVLGNAMVPNWGSAAGRLFSPLQFVPSLGKAGEIAVRPGDAEVLVGGSVTVTATIKNPEKTPYDATLFLRSEGEAESPLPMTGDKTQRRYRLTIPAIRKPCGYRLEIGDSQSPVYRITVREKPVVEDVTVTYRFPSYLRHGEKTVRQPTADLEAPQYTEAELSVRPSTPVDHGYAQFDGRKVAGRVEDGGNRLILRMPMLKDAGFTIHLFLANRLTDEAPRVNRVRVVPDCPPTVEILEPARQINATPDGQVSVAIRAGDDHALGRMRLEMKVLPPGDEAENESPLSLRERARVRANAEETTTSLLPLEAISPHPNPLPKGEGTVNAAPISTVAKWSDLKNMSTVVRRHQLNLKDKDVQPGGTVLLRAVAWDQRYFSQGLTTLKPQQAVSGWHAVKIVSAEAQASAALAELESLRGRLWEIFERQVRARTTTSGILRLDPLARRIAAAGEVNLQQVAIHQKASALIASIAGSERQEVRTIRRVVQGLATGAMLRAVQQAEELMRLKMPEAFSPPLATLTATQDEIIAALRRLLDAVRLAEAELLRESPHRPGGDLPEDVRQKLDEARSKLDEFLKQQKKVLEASEDLAKTPVEDFTEKEEQLLKKLAAVEDDWSKFLKELHSDFSKLPEQDFANASSLTELVEIQVELKMAEDALLKKSVDIAVPLEQLGYERAEELKTNIEKWLPDTPDREKWSQEESLTDADKEAPMAELPGELEDMIGELMEGEEDLFDEMEDVSSSAADSLDKGAGWDAMDGPISNMSAKGVTGNRLPNTSEIGGRSGEGRQGKSAGEFVGDEAVGKGGRKTPSRLTPDPYVQGQIKDHSKDPTGGATGGGKESGQGGEGLEGPGRRPPGERNLARLAGKQAALRNKAEGIDLQFQVADFHHTDLKKMIDVMAQVERDLKAGRYQNALRQRRVLAEGLGGVKQYLEGEFHARRDSTSNLPADVQKEILGVAQDPSPPGWEELNRRYFERLTTGGEADTNPRGK
ncbi:MAG: hypothetical protein JXB10_00675 [Pirellulales bacterium]|nr:hypothetical protein [Pirellulales bacterium]